MSAFYVTKTPEDEWSNEMYFVSRTPRSGALSDFCVRDFERLTGIKLKPGEGKWFKLTETTKPATGRKVKAGTGQASRTRARKTARA